MPVSPGEGVALDQAVLSVLGGLLLDRPPPHHVSRLLPHSRLDIIWVHVVEPQVGAAENPGVNVANFNINTKTSSESRPFCNQIDCSGFLARLTSCIFFSYAPDFTSLVNFTT